MSESSSPPPLLTPYQKKIVATAITGVALALILFLVLGIFTTVGRFLSTFSSVIWPMAVATILTLLLKPLVQTFQRWFKLGRVFAIVLLYSVIVLLLLGASLKIVPFIVQQAIDLFESIPGVYERVIAHLNEVAPGWLAFLESNISTVNLNQFSE